MSKLAVILCLLTLPVVAQAVDQPAFDPSIFDSTAFYSLKIRNPILITVTQQLPLWLQVVDANGQPTELSATDGYPAWSTDNPYCVLVSSVIGKVATVQSAGHPSCQANVTVSVGLFRASIPVWVVATPRWTIDLVPGEIIDTK